MRHFSLSSLLIFDEVNTVIICVFEMKDLRCTDINLPRVMSPESETQLNLEALGWQSCDRKPIKSISWTLLALVHPH